MNKKVPTFDEFLLESIGGFPTELNIFELNDIIKNNKKVWILTGGAPGAGKSYVVRKYLNIQVIDMDDYVTKLSGGNGKYDPNLGMKARVEARKDVDLNFAKGKSFLKQGVSAGLKAVENQCKQAKDAGFICVFLYIDVPLKQAIKNNQHRVESGERQSDIPDYVIERKMNDSKKVFNDIKKSKKLFDYFVYFNNKR